MAKDPLPAAAELLALLLEDADCAAPSTSEAIRLLRASLTEHVARLQARAARLERELYGPKLELVRAV